MSAGAQTAGFWALPVRTVSKAACPGDSMQAWLGGVLLYNFATSPRCQESGHR